MMMKLMMIKLASSPRATSRHQAETGSKTAVRGVQTMMMMKLASSPRANIRHPAQNRCRTAAHRVQTTMMMMKLASCPRAAARHPADYRQTDIRFVFILHKYVSSALYNKGTMSGIMF